MKRLFTLSMLALLTVMTVSAQGYRKWDFTNWGATTIANLQEEAKKGVTGGSWSDTEKADGNNPQVDKCFWSYGDNLIDGELSANGVVIAETAGLVFNQTYVAKRSLAIAVDYPSTEKGNYAGPQYLWLGGGNAKSAGARIACFTIPKVRIGQKITMAVESHSSTDSRGVSLFVGDCTNDAFQIGESFKPTTLDTYTWEGWTLPEGASTNDDGTVDVVIYNTNGCHIYSIEVGDNSQKDKVALLTTTGGDTDVLNILSSRAYTDVTAIDIATIPGDTDGRMAFAETLQKEYSVVVIGPSVPADHYSVGLAKTALPYMPVLNLNAGLYPAWGYGTSVPTLGFAFIKNTNDALFKSVNYEATEEGNALLISNDPFNTMMQAVQLGEYFEDDAILAVGTDDESSVAIHTHNIKHNGYIYFPYVPDYSEQAIQVLHNAIGILANSKAETTDAPAPIISREYKDRYTIVTIKPASKLPKTKIYYTTDGTPPTYLDSQYTEPFTVTEPCTVKAMVTAEGYNYSRAASLAIKIKSLPKTPVIAYNMEEGLTTVTMSSETEGTQLYYNYDASTDTTKSIRYENPVIVKMPTTIYAFAVDVTEPGEEVWSEVATRRVLVKNPHIAIDELAHMDASSAVYNNGSTSTAYYFSWGKSKTTYNYYNVESATEEIVIDPETGNEELVITYTELNPEEEKDFENGWMVRSRGQVVDWENLTTGTNIGQKDGYNYATADDINPNFPATKGCIVLAEKNTVPADATFPYNAYIVTTQKFKGPFDIVANIGSIIKPENEAKHKIVLQIATDANNWDASWQTVGDTIIIKDRQRLTTNVTRSYEGTDEVYVRAYLCSDNSKAGFYDIYIANAGEKSKALLDEINAELAGIQEVKQADSRMAKGIYNLNGIRISSPKRGLNIVVNADGTVKKVMVK